MKHIQSTHKASRIAKKKGPKATMLEQIEKAQAEVATWPPLVRQATEFHPKGYAIAQALSPDLEAASPRIRN